MSKFDELLKGTKITIDDLSEANEAAIQDRLENGDDADAMMAIAAHFRKKRDPMTIVAIFFRMQALAGVVKSGTVEKWSLEAKSERGEVYVNGAVFDAAATCTLRFVENEAKFDTDEFLNLVLSYSEGEGQA